MKNVRPVRTTLSLAAAALLAAIVGVGCPRLDPLGPAAATDTAAPGFDLVAQDGARVSSDALLARGSLVVVFYRGHW